MVLFLGANKPSTTPDFSKRKENGAQAISKLSEPWSNKQRERIDSRKTVHSIVLAHVTKKERNSPVRAGSERGKSPVTDSGAVDRQAGYDRGLSHRGAVLVYRLRGIIFTCNARRRPAELSRARRASYSRVSARPNVTRRWLALSGEPMPSGGSAAVASARV